MNFKQLKEISNLFWPIAMSIILANILSLIDAVMVSGYNILGISAITVATQMQFIFGPMYFAIMTGINIFSVQYFARGDFKELKKLAGIAFTLIIPLALINFLLLWLFDNQIVNFFLPENTEVSTLSMQYIMIFKFSLLLLPFDMFFRYQYRAIRKPKIALYIGLFEATLNVIINYFLIFGIGLFPELGIQGAALGTLFVKIISLTINIFIAMYLKVPFIGKLSEMFSYSKSLFKEVFINTLPLIGIEFGFGAGNVIYSKIYSLTSVVDFTAFNIAKTISFLANAFVIATANVSGILIGGKLSKGLNQEDDELKKTLNNLFIFMFLCSIFLLFFSIFIGPLLLPLFTSKTEYIYLVKHLLIINGIWMAIRVFSSSFIAILKSGNDNKFILFIDVGSVFLVSLPLTILVWYFTKAGIVVLRSMIILEVILKVSLGFYRFKQYRWVKKI